jgi:hypothetical protein
MFGTDLTGLPQTAQEFVSQPQLEYTPNIPTGMGSLLRGIPTIPATRTEQMPIAGQRRLDLPAGMPDLAARRARPLPTQGSEPAAAASQPPLVLRPSERVGGGPLVLAPSQRVQPAPAAGTPMGQALLTQRQRMNVAPTVSMMAPVVEARPGALLLRGNQRAVPAAPTEAVEPAVSGLQISGVDQAIESGVATIEVVEDGKRVPFKNFALSVDGTTAEVGFVERDKGARRGVGYDAYVALGDDLAARGITLQSTPTLQADGRKLWERLVLERKAHFDAQARRFKFGPAPATAPAESIKAKGAETARERARTVALEEARTTKKAVAVAGKPYKDFDDPAGPPMHEVALPDGSLVRIAKTTNMGLTDWVNIDTGANLYADTKADAVRKLGEPFQTPPDTTPPDTTSPADTGPTTSPGPGRRSGTLTSGVKGGGRKAQAEPVVTLAPVVTEPTPVVEAAPVVAPTPEVTAEATPEPEPAPVAEPEPAPEAAPEPAPEVQTTAETPKPSGRKPRPLTAAARESLSTYASIKEGIADLEQKLMPPAAPMQGDKLYAAVDLLFVTDHPDTPTELKKLARGVLEANSMTRGVAALSIAEGVYAARKLADLTGGNDAVLDLTSLITAVNSGTPPEGDWQGYFRALAVLVRREAPDATFGEGGPLLLSYAKANNLPNTARTPQGTQFIKSGGFSLADWNTIDGVVDLDGKPITPIAPGRVQLLVRNFVTKLARKPTVTVVRNQADLKAKNPKLYARAVAARPQGDFDTAAAMGYSFGDGQVIIFSDRIGTEQQLRFVLAHEALGHYGLRSVMPAGKFDALMEAAYNLDERVARAADAAMATRPGLSRAEAVEEYLSDYAAVLDTSLVARVWNALKGILSKLGVRYGDEMTRYLLDQSRRYVRYGTGVTFDAQSVGQRLHNVETSGDTGRFSTGKSLRDVNIEVALTRDTLGVTPQSFGEAWNFIKARSINTIDALDRFKAQVLSLTNYRARINPGSAAFDDSLKQARDISMSLKTKYNEMMRVALSRAVYGELGGISNAKRSTVSNMLMAGLRRGVSDYAAANGDLGRVPLFRIENNKLVPNTAEIERLKESGTRTLAEMRDGFDYNVEFEEGGKTVKKKERFEGVEGLTETSTEWRSYESIRKAMDGIELELLEAHYRSLIDNRDLMFRKLAQSVTDGELTADERAAIVTVAETYSNLYTADVTVSESGGAKLDSDYQTYANDVLRMTNMALIGEETDRFGDLRKLLVEPRKFMLQEDGKDTKRLRRELPATMDAPTADDLIAKLEGFRKRLSLKGDKFAVQDKVKQIITAEIANQDADAYTKRTLFTGYVPILREGRFQMRVVALVGGKPVQVKDSYREQLVYSQFDSLSEAVEMSGKANEAFGNTPFEVMYYSDAAQGYVLGNVTLQAVPETALETVAAPPDLNLNEFLRGIRQFDINLTPQKLEQLVVALTRQNSAARNRLMRAFTPGADPDVIMAASRHIESRASTVAKIATRVRRSELMDRSMRSTNELWNAELKDPRTGRDWAEVLKERADAMDADPAASREAKVDARRIYEAYAHMVKQTRGGPANRANQFYGEAAKTMEFVEGNKSIDESDFGAKPWVSSLRAITSMVQLGGSVATGAMNFVALETNVVPYLASYNSKTAFGGGFGLGNVHREMVRAAVQVGGRSIVDGRFDTAEFFAEVETSDKLQKQFGLSAREAQFLKDGILGGKLTPAQTNSLVGTARGRVTRGATQKAVDAWMWTFNSFERASRQTAGLAAYRLEYARKLAAGKPEAEAHDQATQFSLQALDLTLGDYAVLNRPPAWRSGIQSFAYMYKVFVTTSVQLLSNMDRKGQLFMLGSLWILTGLQGLPFAEDLEDVIDTIAQTLKIPGWQGARYESAQMLDSVFPGMSPVLMQGLVNQFVPGDVAAKTSLGDLLPGSGALIAGADPWRSAMEIFGPAAGMIGATGTFAKAAISAPFTATVDAQDVLRESPVTMMRAAGDVYTYIQNGAVVDRRGYVVSPDMNAGIVLARVLGFYPVAPSREYEMIGMAKRITDFQREQTTAYRVGWIRAMMEGDRARAREIEQEVATWNAGSKGTGLEIRDFVKNSQRALKEARRPVMERTLRSAPDAAERDLRNMMELMSVN